MLTCDSLVRNGPSRHTESSYGFLRSEPFEPTSRSEHVGARPFTNPEDGELYIQTIVWFMVKGKIIPHRHEFPPFPSFHNKALKEKQFLCEEVLYVSDEATESHYPLDHRKNKGKCCANIG